MVPGRLVQEAPGGEVRAQQRFVNDRSVLSLHSLSTLAIETELLTSSAAAVCFC